MSVIYDIRGEGLTPRTMRQAAGSPRSDVLHPDPGGTIQSHTALGYTPEAATAHPAGNNSIAAGARTVTIRFHWADAAGSTVSVVHDGQGMTGGGAPAGTTVADADSRPTRRSVTWAGSAWA